MTTTTDNDMISQWQRHQWMTWHSSPLVNAQYGEQFARDGAKIKATLRIKLPHESCDDAEAASGDKVI